MILVDSNSDVPDGPVAYVLLGKYINHLQLATIRRLITRAKHASMVDMVLRINGKNEYFEIDWIKHLTEKNTECIDEIAALESRIASLTIREKQAEELLRFASYSTGSPLHDRRHMWLSEQKK